MPFNLLIFFKSYYCASNLGLSSDLYENKGEHPNLESRIAVVYEIYRNIEKPNEKTVRGYLYLEPSMDKNGFKNKVINEFLTSLSEQTRLKADKKDKGEDQETEALCFSLLLEKSNASKLVEKVKAPFFTYLKKLKSTTKDIKKKEGEFKSSMYDTVSMTSSIGNLSIDQDFEYKKGSTLTLSNHNEEVSTKGKFEVKPPQNADYSQKTWRNTIIGNDLNKTETLFKKPDCLNPQQMQVEREGTLKRNFESKKEPIKSDFDLNQRKIQEHSREEINQSTNLRRHPYSVEEPQTLPRASSTMQYGKKADNKTSTIPQKLRQEQQQSTKPSDRNVSYEYSEDETDVELEEEEPQTLPRAPSTMQYGKKADNKTSSRQQKLRQEHQQPTKHSDRNKSYEYLEDETDVELEAEKSHYMTRAPTTMQYGKKADNKTSSTLPKLRHEYQQPTKHSDRNKSYEYSEDRSNVALKAEKSHYMTRASPTMKYGEKADIKTSLRLQTLPNNYKNEYRQSSMPADSETYYEDSDSGSDDTIGEEEPEDKRKYRINLDLDSNDDPGASDVETIEIYPRTNQSKLLKRRSASSVGTHLNTIPKAPPLDMTLKRMPEPNKSSTNQTPGSDVAGAFDAVMLEIQDTFRKKRMKSLQSKKATQ